MPRSSNSHSSSAGSPAVRAGVPLMVVAKALNMIACRITPAMRWWCSPARMVARGGSLVQQLLEQRDQRHEGPRSLLRVFGEQLLRELSERR